MDPSPSALLHEWHDFYVLVGTASATLVGLMFVAVSIGTTIFNEDDRAAACCGRARSPRRAPEGGAVWLPRHQRPHR
jgi:hypothetical protein